MREERFENAMEHFGDAVERTVEGAANVFDKCMNKAWKFRPIRLAGKTLSFLTGAGLILSSASIAEKGYHRAAKICLISGSVIILAQIVEWMIFRKK